MQLEFNRESTLLALYAEKSSLQQLAEIENFGTAFTNIQHYGYFKDIFYKNIGDFLFLTDTMEYD